MCIIVDGYYIYIHNTNSGASLLSPQQFVHSNVCLVLWYWSKVTVNSNKQVSVGRKNSKDNDIAAVLQVTKKYQAGNSDMRINVSLGSNDAWKPLLIDLRDDKPFQVSLNIFKYDIIRAYIPWLLI